MQTPERFFFFFFFFFFFTVWSYASLNFTGVNLLFSSATETLKKQTAKT